MRCITLRFIGNSPLQHVRGTLKGSEGTRTIAAMGNLHYVRLYNRAHTNKHSHSLHTHTHTAARCSPTPTHTLACLLRVPYLLPRVPNIFVSYSSNTKSTSNDEIDLKPSDCSNNRQLMYTMVISTSYFLAVSDRQSSNKNTTNLNETDLFYYA